LDTSFVGASAPKKIVGDFLILPSSVWVLSNEIESWNLLIFSLTFPSRFWPAALAVPSGRDSPASGALLLGDGEKRQR